MSPTQRLGQIASHLGAQPANRTQIGTKNPDDVVVVSALRTPITRARKGGFKDTAPEYLLAAVLKGILDRTKIDPAVVEDISVGNVCTPAGGATHARMAMLYAGFPETTCVHTVNRQCSSGLQTVTHIANAIQSGMIEAGIGAGVESMSFYYDPTKLIVVDKLSQEVLSNEASTGCLIPMGVTSENVAKQFGVDRKKQDELAALSHERAAKAQKSGLFDDEIVAVKTKVVDKDGEEKEIVVTKDDGIRPGTTAENLSKLRTVFSKDGTTTAGNSSQVSDGAAAVLLMKRSKAQSLGLPILGKYVIANVSGVPPQIMGIGPAYAIPAAAKKAGIDVQDIDIIELNEAFASQAVYCAEKLNLSPEKVNPKGGAIAIGHPLGCTGARQVATLFTELKRQNKRIGAVSMCIGTGMGMCAIFERE
ncbi:3-ketoacyl-CoA thiolase with broad chain length specificity [Mycoemilia scoparia]|uniref:3-ketoacyl-CoA thiolase with broad chain length specificity n=1 Tax=Mycoemilia scoparia TaxID=417184 RepID=A0A9W8A3L6_9FUNG|nr:3-ketoacyl-CoA thiolase with broad chain length specificity [Mycoemilia scoparia]